MHVNNTPPTRLLLNPIHEESARVLGNNDTSTSTGMTSTDSPAGITSTDSQSGGGIALTIVCFIVLLPCILAACAQSIYCVKKRRRDRIERQVLAVCTNPASRMLVLNEIFKDDGRPVTEDEAHAVKKKKVLVKKHRKRTQEELRGKSSGSDSFRPDHDTESVERYRKNIAESDVEDQMNETGWNENEDGILDRKRPMFVYFSGKVVANDERTLEQDNLSTLDGEEHGSTSHDHVRTQHDADQVSGGGFTSKADQWIGIQPDVECGEGVLMNGNIYAGADDDTNDRAIDSNPDPIVSSMTTGLSHDVEKIPSSPEIIFRKSDDNLDSCVEKMGTTKTAALPCLVTPDRSPNSAFESIVGTSPTSLPLEELNNPPEIPILGGAETFPSSYLSPRALSPHTMIVRANADMIVSSLRSFPDLSDDDSDDGDARRAAILPLFRATNHSIPEIRPCGSDVTEVTSNVDGKEIGGQSAEPLRGTLVDDANDISTSRYHQLNAGNRLGDGLIPVIKSASYNSTDRSLSSTVSYFSYEDVSVASEESEMCAICLCAYEEGDIRIFSKKCSHAFHKECILEWLVKSQQCPCCRIDMVSKSEIKLISASLIGTERLAQAMAVVNESGMQEGAPFRARRPRLARHLLSVARSPMRLSFSAGQASPSATRSRAHTHDDTNTHNRDWAWTNRFLDDAQARTINPSRSSDAIMNPHETNQSHTESVSGITTAGGGASMHSTLAGSLIMHAHWQQTRLVPSTPSGSQYNSIAHVNWHRTRTVPSSGGSQYNSIAHENWQRMRPVPSTPSNSQNSSIIHDYWQQPRVTRPTRRDRNNPLQLHVTSAHPSWSQNVPSNSEAHLPVVTLPAI